MSMSNFKTIFDTNNDPFRYVKVSEPAKNIDRAKRKTFNEERAKIKSVVPHFVKTSIDLGFIMQNLG